MKQLERQSGRLLAIRLLKIDSVQRKGIQVRVKDVHDKECVAVTAHGIDIPAGVA